MRRRFDLDVPESWETEVTKILSSLKGKRKNMYSKAFKIWIEEIVADRQKLRTKVNTQAHTIKQKDKKIAKLQDKIPRGTAQKQTSRAGPSSESKRELKGTPILLYDPAKKAEYEAKGMFRCEISETYVYPSHCEICGTFNCDRNKNPQNPHLKKEPRSIEEPKETVKEQEPKAEEQWKVTDEWINKWLLESESWQQLPYPFPCPYEKGKSCYQSQHQLCKKNTRSKFELCQKEKRRLFEIINRKQSVRVPSI